MTNTTTETVAEARNRLSTVKNLDWVLEMLRSGKGGVTPDKFRAGAAANMGLSAADIEIIIAWAGR